MATTRIISIDGGGVRGIIPTIVLQRLEAQPGLEGWLARTDLFAGTSTGGLIALALAAGFDLTLVRSLYEVRAAEVFADSWFDDVRDLGKILGADYDVDNLRAVLDDVFGELRLRDLARARARHHVRPQRRGPRRPGSRRSSTTIPVPTPTARCSSQGRHVHERGTDVLRQ